MRFDVPPHLRELTGRLREFVDGEVVPAEPVLHRGGPEARATLVRLRQAAKDAGLWALGHPAELGGGGMSFLDYVYVNEIQGRSEYGQLALGTATLQDTLMLHRHASPETAARYVPGLVAGEMMPSFAMTEPGVSSSDPTQLETAARLDGDDWVVSGRKWFITGARDAAFTTVMCRTEPPDAPPHRAFSLILVPRDAAGYELVRDLPVLGIDHGHYEIAFHDVRTPAHNLVGERGRGFQVAQERLGPGRIFHAMRWLGQAQRALELMVGRLRERRAFGEPLAEKQLMQQHVFESYAQIQACRLLTLDAARALDAGDAARVEIATIKVLGARMINDVVDRALQVFGAAGLTDDTPLGFMYRTARFARIYDGPDEVHIRSVARTLIRDGRDR
ncbi:acyl-CoA dehydrogenase [Actinomadura craniellae]|uniref:Acyl-CoA dehydrogenase n=1 Tax=Actinomadura craniellae TaxID=2231787 RepID=A0A365GYT6_9ACTN|nr:acyl-CoA dehydrogenase family protein [Actinomadura craniellae]RAY11966.1 acyl-CoA dehydrogenase [Actinomadura craniellae]